MPTPSPTTEPNGDDLLLSVEGYKAVRTRQELRIAPLTVISGVNSSGKSSFMQPFLLMKQTLDSVFDPGPLLLYGPNVKVTQYSQMFSRGKARTDASDRFTVGLARGPEARAVAFTANYGGLRIQTDTVVNADGHVTELRLGRSPAQVRKLRSQLQPRAQGYIDILARGANSQEVGWDPVVTRTRCFLDAEIVLKQGESTYNLSAELTSREPGNPSWGELLRGIIHVPGLRGNPEREYQRSAVGSTYPGTFETYVASILFEWGDTPRLAAVARDLEHLGLTWKVVARRVSDASVELMVGRMAHAQRGGAHDLVSVADVGFGVSQTLPVLVALHAARPGQIVYVEQPEIHLHPRAQLALADCLVAAATRGVLVIAETHSSLVIRGIQIAVARGALSPEHLSLNWFSRSVIDGSQRIDVAKLDSMGRFGDWPVDFDDIGREADWAYLEAVEDRS